MSSGRSDPTPNGTTCGAKEDHLASGREEEDEDRAKEGSLAGDKVFEPIKTVRNGGHRVTSRGSGRPASLQQSRSYGDGHGFTCFSNDEADAGRTPAAEWGAEAEVFEVQWNGENDTANPRSMSRLRKWMIVLIVSSSSACV